jgi:membrane-associated HD superfamily phosphohydrolase
MKQQFPRLLVFIFGVFLLFQFFVPHEKSEWVYEYLLDWIIIIGVFALAIGIWSLIRVHTDKIKNRKIGWQYSYVTLAGLFGFIVFGFTIRNGEEWGFFFPFVAAVVGAILMFVQAMASRAKATMFAGIGGVCVLIAVIIGIFDSAFSFHFATSEGLQAFMFRHSFDHVLIPIFATMFSLLAFFIASAAYRAFRARSVMATLLLLAAIIVMSRFNPYLEPIFGVYIAKTSTWLMNVPNLAAQRAIVMGVGLGIVATGLKVILGIERKYMG